MERVWVLAVLALAGCDWVLGLDDRMGPPVDAAADAIDAPDARRIVCWDPSFTGNEDTDTLVDGCDNCPLITNEPQRDSDMDGVGDACDANPMLPLEQIAFFEPMSRYITSAWTALGNGSWTTGVGNDDVKQQNQGQTMNVAALLLYNAPAVDVPTIQIKVLSASPDKDALDLSVVGLYMAVDATLDDATPDGMICGIEYPTATQTTLRSWSRVQRSGVSDPPRSAPLLAGDLTSVVTLSTATPAAGSSVSMATCTVQRGTEVVPTPMGTTVAVNGARVGLWTSNASATFQALFATRRRPGL